MMAVTSISAEERVALLEKEPKADLFAALDFYFEHLNRGRPFILAGHSQGSQMMTYVLTEYMEEHPEYYERMVAAYALGYSITKQLLALLMPGAVPMQWKAARSMSAVEAMLPATRPSTIFRRHIMAPK